MAYLVIPQKTEANLTDNTGVIHVPQLLAFRTGDVAKPLHDLQRDLSANIVL